VRGQVDPSIQARGAASAQAIHMFLCLLRAFTVPSNIQTSCNYSLQLHGLLQHNTRLFKRARVVHHQEVYLLLEHFVFTSTVQTPSGDLPPLRHMPIDGPLYWICLH
jgi:hypothetical protein